MVFLPSAVALLFSAGAYAASLQQVVNFGTNPTNVGMFVYKPDKLPSHPPLLVAAHYCQGSAQAYFSGTPFKGLADQYGVLMIYPDAPDPGGCWDVHTNATLTHNTGGDSLGIASMVKYAIQNYGADANRVYVVGSSSGAMMTSVLMGAYPDLFKGGSAFSGVPYGCFSGPSLWNSQCASGQRIMTAQQWGDMVRSGYPGYTGPRPKLQIWHGTADTTLYPQNFYEEIKQWNNVFNYSQTAQQTISDSPLKGYSRSIYGDHFQAILAQGVGHGVPEQGPEVFTFFGLNQPAGTSPTSTQSSAPPSSTTSQTPTNPPSQGGTVAQYGQCGGQDWNGGTVCVSPYTCKYSNPYYSQCL